MNRITIAAIAPYEGLQNSLKAVAARFSEFIDVDIIAGNLEECVRYLRLFSEKKFDLIISRGGTAEYLHNITTIPVIEIEISAYDMLHAIKATEQLTDNFIVVGFPRFVSIAKLIKDILQYSYETIEISSETEADAVLREICGRKPLPYVIGDTVTVQLAAQIGIPNHLIVSGKESVEKAYRDAIQYYNNLSGVRLDRDIFRGILEYCDSSIIVYNAERQLYFHNLNWRKNDFFSLFDLTKECIEKLVELSEIHLVKRQAPYIFQIHGKRLDLGERSYYLFYIRDLPSKKYHESFLNIEENENNFQVLMARTALMKNLNGVIGFLKDRSNLPVHLCGAFGTDADGIARYIHYKLSGEQSSMITINCKTINEKNWNAMIEDDNAPLNAVKYSIYFKDVHLLSSEMQALVDNYISDTALPMRHFLLCSATPQLERMLENGSFLESLYQKLTGVCFRIPSLNEYPNEIPAISQIYIKMFNESLGKEVIGFTQQAMEVLKSHPFHHNLHQLEQTIKQFMIGCDGFYISEEEVRHAFYANDVSAEPPTSIGLNKTLEEIESEIIRRVLVEENMNQTKAAQRLGISRSTLWRKLK